MINTDPCEKSHDQEHIKNLEKSFLYILEVFARTVVIKIIMQIIIVMDCITKGIDRLVYFIICIPF